MKRRRLVFAPDNGSSTWRGLTSDFFIGSLPITAWQIFLSPSTQGTTACLVIRTRVGSRSVADLDHDLADVVGRFQIRVGFARLIKAEDPIDGRPNLCGGDEPVEILEHRATADESAHQTCGSEQDRLNL